MFLRFPETNRAALAQADEPPRVQKRGRIIKRKSGGRKDSATGAQSGSRVRDKAEARLQFRTVDALQRSRLIGEFREVAIVEQRERMFSAHQHRALVVLEHLARRKRPSAM